MARRIGFLRAINLGAKRKFPNAAILKAVAAAGFTDAETYINTGNVRFETTLRARPRIESALEEAFEAEAGFEVPAIVFTPAELRDVAEQAASFGHTGRHYVSLCKQVPTAAAIRRLEESSAADEVVKVGGRAVHLLLGESYRQARLTNAVVERHVGVATNRSLTVIDALVQRWC